MLQRSAQIPGLPFAGQANGYHHRHVQAGGYAQDFDVWATSATGVERQGCGAREDGETEASDQLAVCRYEEERDGDGGFAGYGNADESSDEGEVWLVTDQKHDHFCRLRIY